MFFGYGSPCPYINNEWKRAARSLQIRGSRAEGVLFVRRADG